MYSPTVISTFLSPRALLLSALLGLATAAASPAQARGSGEFFAPTQTGSLRSIRRHTDFRNTWHLIVPGRFGGTHWHTDLLFYDRITGDGSFYTSNGSGDIQLLRHLPNFHKGWDLIVPGQFGGSAHTDLLFYDRNTGKAEFYTTDGTGRLSLLKVSLLGDWDIIIPGRFGGSSHTDLFFYSRTRGEGALYLTDGLGGMTRRFHSTHLRKIWDLIVPGDFNGDSITDLLFYSQVLGETQTHRTDGSGGLVYMRTHQMPKFWDIIVPLEDPSFATSKLLFYDRNAGTAQQATVSTSGAILLKPRQAVSKRWYSIVPGLFDNDSNTDFLCYDNTYRLRIHAIRCMDSDGGRATAITPSQVQAWVAEANRVYSSAGLFFEFDPMGDYEELRSTVINSLDVCSRFSTPALCKLSGDASAGFAAQCGGKIAVFFRWGNGTVPSGKGFSSGRGNVIAMPGFGNTSTAKYYHDPSTPGHNTIVQNIGLLAHELGHYLAIGHTFVGVDYQGYSNPHDAVVAFMTARNATTMDILDGDRAGILDTPPDVHATYYLMKGWNPADRNQEITISSAPNNISFSFNTDRYGVMSYWPICDDYRRISPGQRRRVREWLHEPHRINLIDGMVPRLTRFGIGCSAGQSTPATHSASGCPRPGNYLSYDFTNGAPNQVAAFMLGAMRYLSPLDLGSIGAPGCMVYGSPGFSLNFSTDAIGSATVRLRIPNIPRLAGTHAYSQFVCVAPGVNNLGVAVTNGVDTQIGN